MYMKSQKKKSPNDYPQFTFRIDLERKRILLDLLDKAKKHLNSSVRSDEKVINKNDIIFQAMRTGLINLLNNKRINRPPTPKKKR
jgi:hypothetical protein